MHAIVIGATGATGKDLVQQILNDNYFTHLTVFVRRSTGLKHPKLTEEVINFDDKKSWSSKVNGDVLFSCLGSTLKDAKSKENQWKIDFTYQFEFAKEAARNNVENYVLISATNASPKSLFFYSKMKGELEVAVKALNFKSIQIFQPPLLVRENSNRWAEKWAEKILNFLNQIGLFKSSAPLKTVDLAKAMILSTKLNLKGIKIYKPIEIKAFIESSKQ